MSEKEERIKLIQEVLSTADLNVTKKWYSKWASNYEQDIAFMEYNGPEVTVNEFLSLNIPKDARILDIGMGTGNVGIHLKQNGYTNIDGLDASPEMVEIAKQRNCYKNLICSSVEKETRLPIEDKTYDVVIMAGCLCPGHIRWNSFPQIIRIVKSGGVVFWLVAVSKTFEEKDEDFRNGNNENLVKSLTTEGKWDYINGYPKRVENYMIGTEGDIYAMKVQ
ncbi:unnamed protein product [Medioppia subpectinata]|uniref:Methyltransferase domain-containing protein n=1 Tax=Medioppia subpectinata TaxID=1979941 RepID=A0A7R9KSY3_9ACAR|nr:unnamed protein product [Medioppia subpectinata]CAG2108851.1 unnamed protein product [Medioppia subpectinata]